MNRQHAILALPRSVLDVHVPDQHETQPGARRPRELRKALEPARPLVGAHSTQHRDCRHIVVGQLEPARIGTGLVRIRAFAPRHHQNARRRVRDDGDRVLGKIALERVGGPARRRDQERCARQQRTMAQPPVHDVDGRERRLRAEACAALDGIGFLVAIVAIRREKQDGRTGEVEIVDRVAVRHAERRQRRDDAVAASGNVVQVDEIDREACADSAEEGRPRLVAAAAKVEPAHVPADGKFLDPPEIVHGNRKMVPVARPDAPISARAWCSVPPPWP